MSAVQVTLTDEQRKMLIALGKNMGMREASDVVAYLIASVQDGVRRPGSWERGIVTQLFGEGVYEAEAHIPEDYKGRPFR